MTDDLDGTFVPDPENDAQWELAYDTLAAWLECPCDFHTFYVGVTCGNVEGFAARYVVQAFADEIAKEDTDMEIPDGVDVLRINDLLAALYAPDDDATTRT